MAPGLGADPGIRGRADQLAKRRGWLIAVGKLVQATCSDPNHGHVHQMFGDEPDLQFVGS